MTAQERDDFIAARLAELTAAVKHGAEAQLETRAEIREVLGLLREHMRDEAATIRRVRYLEQLCGVSEPPPARAANGGGE